MSRYAVVILIALTLLLPGLVSHFIGAGSGPALPAGVKVEGRLDIVTSHNQDIRNEFAAAFARWHQRNFGTVVELRYTAPGGTGDIRRLLESNYRNAKDADGKLRPGFRAPFDLAWGGGDFFFDIEIKNLLQGVDLPPEVLDAAFPQPRLAGVRLYDFTLDKDGKRLPPKWVGVCISSFGIVYNPDVYRRLRLPAPTTWNDLTNPILQGWVALANPASSSSAAVSYSMVYQRAMADEEERVLAARPDLAKLPGAERMKDPAFKAEIAKGWKRGMGTLLLVAANARYFTDSGTQPPADVANGDAAVAMAIDFYGRNYEGTVGGDRAKLVTPAGATAINPDPVAVLLGTNPEQSKLAARFIEFLLSPEAQRLWILKPGTPGAPERALYRPPVRRDVYLPPTGTGTPADIANWTHPDLNPFTDSAGFNQRSEFNTLFTETRIVWAASWIDAREELKDAYRAVLAVSDDARRQQLIAQLADIPLTYPELEKLRADLRAVPANLRDEARARFRIDIANRFRAHYATVKNAAVQ